MLEGLKRFFSGAAAPARGWEGLAPWAESKGYTFKPVKEGDGFIVEGRLGAQPWRLEWGPSQRPYIEGSELRLRSELGLPSDLQVLLMNRPLQERLEKEVFEQYVEGVQTRIDTETPPEMRWLVMFPKLPASEMGALRERYIALASIKPWLVHWLEGPLPAALLALQAEPSQPLVLMIGRGRLSLRTPMATPDARDLEPWLRLYETALREARRVATLGVDPGAPSTQPSMWSATSTPPAEDPKTKK
jgi:hypothetical protein